MVQETLGFADNKGMEQENLFIGHMLGDGSIPNEKNNRFSYGQKEDFKEWVEYSYETMQPYTQDKKLSYATQKKVGKVGYKKPEYFSYRYRTRCDPKFVIERDRWYVRTTKVIPKDLRLNWEIAATWFADDGCNSQTNKCVYLHSESFNEQENDFLISLLKQDLGIVATRNKKGRNWLIRIKSESYFDFMRNVIRILGDIKCLSKKLDISLAKTLPDKSEFIYDDSVKQVAKAMVDSGMTYTQIAKEMGVYRKTLTRWFGLKNKVPATKLKAKFDQVKALWESGITNKTEIAKIAGVHRRTAYRWLANENSCVK